MEELKKLTINLLQWLRSFSFYRTKVIVFTTMVTGVFFDAFVKLDFKEFKFEYNNGDTPTFIIIAIIFASIIFILFNFWYEIVRSKERKDNKILELLKDDSIPNELKIELLKFLTDESK